MTFGRMMGAAGRAAGLLVGLSAGGVLLAGLADARAETVTAARETVTDYKSIYGEVRSRRIAPARSRIGGTIAELAVREGDEVEAGQALATIGDPKIGLQIEAIESRIAALEASVANALSERDRSAELFERRVISQAVLDRAQTTYDVARRQLESARSDRDVLVEQLGEGVVLAPRAGRVLEVLAVGGAVVTPGEVIARIAQRDFVLRLSLPERHASRIAVGDAVAVADPRMGRSAGWGGGEVGTRVEGRVVLVYPDVTAGRVTADAEVAGLGDFFVGERLQTWIAIGERETIAIPGAAVTTRYGIDFVTLVEGDAERDVVVRLGQPLGAAPDRVEVLSGLQGGEALRLPDAGAAGGGQ